MSEVLVDYNRINKKVNDLDIIINRLNGYYNELEDTKTTIASAWNGTASEEMIKKISYLIDKVEEDIDKYYDLRDSLKASADFWKARERELEMAINKEEKK